MKVGKIIVGIVAGIAAGAVVGVLFAPEKGSRTRRKIMDKSDDYAEDLKENFDEFVEAMNKKYQSTTKEVENILAKGKTKYESVLSEVNDLIAKDKAKLDGAAKHEKAI